MEDLVPVIDQVLDSLRRGQIELSNGQEIREALLTLRTIALQKERNDSQAADAKPVPTAASLKPQ